MTYPLFRLLRYARGYRGQVIRATIYSILNKIFDIAPEILIGVAVDSVVKQDKSWLASMGAGDIRQQLVVLGVLTFLIWSFESLFEYLLSVSWRNLAQTMQHRLRLDGYDHVQHLDMAYFEDKSSGNLLSILNDDVNQLERFLDEGANQVIQVFVSSFIIGGIFFFITPSVAVFAVLPIPLILIGAFYFQNRLAPRFLAVRNKAGELNTRLANNITGIFTIKSFTAEEYECKQVEKDSDSYAAANRKAIALSSMVNPVIRIAVLAGFLSTLMYGGFLTINGQLGVGSFSILVFLTQRLLWPLTRLADITLLYQRAMASTERVLGLLDTPIAIPKGIVPLEKDQVRGQITFNDVSFSYTPGHPIIEHLYLNIPAGETVAFVGTTGSGKSTLVKLLLRFYMPSSGNILLDGQDIAELNPIDLRGSIAIVSQDVFLFQGTVAENIAYAMPGTAMEAIIAAAQAAEAHAFIMRLPEGYNTIVGERGQKLSGGQRQRLAIARAILKNPPVLILDEATSAVDNETEMAIQRSLEKIVIGRTTLMIAHRLSTVRNAHTIFVLEHGKIREHGSHDALLEENGIYAALWKLQTGEGRGEVGKIEG